MFFDKKEICAFVVCALFVGGLGYLAVSQDEKQARYERAINSRTLTVQQQNEIINRLIKIKGE